MLFTASTSTIADIGAVSSTAFNDIAPWVYLVAGIVLGFFVIETLIGIASQSKEGHKMADKALVESRKTLYE